MSLKIMETKNLEEALKAADVMDFNTASILLNRAMDEDQYPSIVWASMSADQTKVTVTFSKVGDATNFFKAVLAQLNGR